MSAECECGYHIDHSNRIGKLEAEVDNLGDMFTRLDKENAVTQQKIFSTLESLAKLPETMVSIKDAMVGMQTEITTSNVRMGNLEANVNSLSAQVSKANERITEVDEDGKFNLRKFMQKHTFEIVLALTLLSLYGIPKIVAMLK